MTTDRIKVAIVGASGYTGGELLRLLAGHPRVHITTLLGSERSAGRHISDLFPNLASTLSLTVDALDPLALSKGVDLVFLALPHTEALRTAATLVDLGTRVIDLSADYRLKDPFSYEQWYGTTHPFPDLLREAVYGLPEIHRSEIPKARLIAVPGCYPTAAILQLAPLVAHQLLEPGSILIDAKSGVSGAGRSPALPYHFPEAHGGMHAYKIGRHRHLPEIQQELEALSPSSPTTPHQDLSIGPITFTPHLVPLNRGILSTAYATAKETPEPTNWSDLYQTFYRGEPYVRVFASPDAVNPHHVQGANFCDIGIAYDDRSRRVVTVAALDNLVKGAAGQAIQAMNLMMDLPETLGLTSPGLYP